MSVVKSVIVGDGAPIVSDICEELQKSMTKYPLFNSAHEGYAVILEELDELWDEVKKREPDVKNMRAEAVQVAAMAMKFIISMEADWEPDPKIVSEEKPLQNEANCLQCLYSIMTEEELAQLGSDPCDTCHDLSNWKPKEEAIDPKWMVCENCANQPLGSDIPERCETCEDNDYGRPNNFVRRKVKP